MFNITTIRNSCFVQWDTQTVECVKMEYLILILLFLLQVKKSKQKNPAAYRKTLKIYSLWLKFTNSGCKK